MAPKKALTTTDNKPLRAVGYIRVSTQSQAEEGESLDTQKKQIEAHAKSKGWELVRIYEDAGISGSKAANRPALNELMRDADEGGFKHLIITKLSRFARNTKDFLALKDKLETLGVAITSIQENIDPSTHTGTLMLTLLAAIAQWEREVIRDQMAENKMAKWADHRTFIGKPPFGYRWNKKKRELTIDKREAATYRRVVKMYVDQGLSYRDITIQLRKEHIRCKRAYFSDTTLSYMLKNPCYYGQYAVNTRIYEDHPTKGAGKQRTKKLKPVEEQIEFPIDSLISKTEWDRIQERTEFNKVKSKRTTWSTDYWLRDIVKCGQCDGKMHAHMGSKRKDGTFLRYYCCYWASTSAKNLEAASHEKCDLPYVPADSLEHMVWSRVLFLLKHPYHRAKNIEPLLDMRRDYEEDIKNLEQELTMLEQDEKKLKKARKRQLDLWDDEEIDNKAEIKERLYANKQKTLEVQGMMAEIEERLKKTSEDRDNERASREFIREKGPAIDRMLADMERLDPADRKRVIESLVDGPLMVYWDWEALVEHLQGAVPQPLGVRTAKESESHRKSLTARQEAAAATTWRVLNSREEVEAPLKPGPYFKAKFRFNVEIFQWLQDEGKISPIDNPDPNDDPPKCIGNKGKNAGQKVMPLDHNAPRNPATPELR